jgi:outer membrane lipoprotein-sorting protein
MIKIAIESAIRLVVLSLALLAAGFAPAGAAPDISKYTSDALKTLQCDSVVTYDNQAELKKIGGDFANAYRLHRMTMSYVQPGKLHLETVVMGAHISYTINGNTRYTSVPTLHIHKVEDVTGAPRKKQTLIESGLIPPDLLKEWQFNYLRKESNLLVFQVKSNLASERAYDIFWLDPSTHVITKRYNYNQDGKLIKWIAYKNVTQPVPGIYIPTRIEVYNAQNKLAAVTTYKNVRVNAPVSDSIFNF